MLGVKLESLGGGRQSGGKQFRTLHMVLELSKSWDEHEGRDRYEYLRKSPLGTWRMGPDPEFIPGQTG